MSLHTEQERVASVPVEAGVFALRYISSASSTPPRVFVEPSPASRAHVQIIFVPGKPAGVLEQPQQLALVVAERKSHIQLTVCAAYGGGTSARVELEALQTASEAAPSPPERKAQASAETELATGPSLTCHVAKRGDIAAAEGEWICGPEAPSVIEGVQIEWAGLDPLALEYQVLVQGTGNQWSPWVRAGQFAGTRGRGLAVMGMRIRLTAAAPASAELAAEAAFLGCPLISEHGRELALTSYSGADPLVGLRLQRARAEARDQDIAVSEAARNEPAPPPAGTALKVFKSKRAGDRVIGLGG